MRKKQAGDRWAPSRVLRNFTITREEGASKRSIDTIWAIFQNKITSYVKNKQPNPVATPFLNARATTATLKPQICHINDISQAKIFTFALKLALFVVPTFDRRMTS